MKGLGFRLDDEDVEIGTRRAPDYPKHDAEVIELGGKSRRDPAIIADSWRATPMVNGVGAMSATRTREDPSVPTLRFPSDFAVGLVNWATSWSDHGGPALAQGEVDV